jgi:hypothetical protein
LGFGLVSRLVFFTQQVASSVGQDRKELKINIFIIIYGNKLSIYIYACAF